MKNFVYLFVSIIFLFNFSSCTSSKVSEKDTSIFGIWYPQKPNSKNRVRISENLFISERIRYSQKKDTTENTSEEITKKVGEWQVRDTIKIIEKEFIKNKENQNTISLVLARQKNEKIQYNSFLFSQTEVKGIMTIFAAVNSGFETIEEAKKGMEEAKFKNISQDLLFSEEYVQTVFPTLKPMEDITKEDYITTVKYVRSFEKDLKALAKEKGSNQEKNIRYEIKKYSKIVAEKKLYFLGYNPNNLPENGDDYLKKFEGDKEIEELNNVETEIKF